MQQGVRNEACSLVKAGNLACLIVLHVVLPSDRLSILLPLPWVLKSDTNAPRPLLYCVDTVVQWKFVYSDRALSHLCALWLGITASLHIFSATTLVVLTARPLL